MNEYGNNSVADSHAFVVRAKKEIEEAWQCLAYVGEARLEKESLSAMRDMLDAIEQSLWEKHE